MEGNLCWNCQCIVDCEPSVRPCKKGECCKFYPLEKNLTCAKLAEYLGTTEQYIRTLILRHGPDEIVERMKKKGIDVKFTYSEQNLKFYKVANACV